MSYWNQNFKLCIKVWVVTHFNSAGGLIGRHKWDTCVTRAEYSKTNESHWQQVLTETWNWHNMEWAANNDALYIASSVTLLSLSGLHSALCSLCPLVPAHEAVIRREPVLDTWDRSLVHRASPPPLGVIGQSEARVASGDQSEGEPSTCLSRLKVSHY